jgi:hypothetical protein
MMRAGAGAKRQLFPAAVDDKFKITLFQNEGLTFIPSKKLDWPYRFLMTGFVSTIDTTKKDVKGYPVQVKIPGVEVALTSVNSQVYLELSHGSTITRVECTIHKAKEGGKLPDITSDKRMNLLTHPRFKGEFSVSIWFTKNSKVATGYLNRKNLLSALGQQPPGSGSGKGLTIEDPKHPLHYLTSPPVPREYTEIQDDDDKENDMEEEEDIEVA